MHPLLMHATITITITITTTTTTTARTRTTSEIINWMDCCVRICTVLDGSLVVQQIILHAIAIPPVYLAI